MKLSLDELLDALTELLDDLDGAKGGEELEDLNATLEDVIFLLEEADPDDCADDLEDALAELKDLQAGYAAIPGLFPYAERLKDLLA